MYTPALHQEIARQRQAEMLREADAQRLAALADSDHEAEPLGFLRRFGMRPRPEAVRPALGTNA